MEQLYPLISDKVDYAGNSHFFSIGAQEVSELVESTAGIYMIPIKSTYYFEDYKVNDTTSNFGSRVSKEDLKVKHMSSYWADCCDSEESCK